MTQHMLKPGQPVLIAQAKELGYAPRWCGVVFIKRAHQNWNNNGYHYYLYRFTKTGKKEDLPYFLLGDELIPAGFRDKALKDYL